MLFNHIDGRATTPHLITMGNALVSLADYEELRLEKTIRKSQAAAPFPKPPPQSDQAMKTEQLLYIDDAVAAPHMGWGFPRSSNAIRALARLSERMTVVPWQDVPTAEDTVRFHDLGNVKVLAIDGNDGLSNTALAKAVRDADVIWVSRLRNLQASLPLLSQRKPESRLIYDAEVLVSIREDKRLDVWPGEGRNAPSFAEEVFLLAQADTVVAVCDQDAALLKQAGVREVTVLGHPLKVSPSVSAFEARHRIVHFGSFRKLKLASPNYDAAQFLARSVFPKLTSDMRGHAFFAGQQSQQLHAGSYQIPGVTADQVLGDIDDLAAFYESARLLVAPTRFAGGIPWKVHESFAYGVPILMSGLLADQVGLAEDHPLRVNDLSNFSAAIERLYLDADLWTECRNFGLDYVRDHCRPEDFQDRVRRIIGQQTGPLHETSILS